ncbi:MAG: hypothetical protein GY838_05400, partial [bacterium]|nr:hypothetical protein [bacterium]
MKCAPLVLSLIALAAGFGPRGTATAQVVDGYNLFTPIRSTDTYLMDNDGNVVHTWSSAYNPGMSVYL